MTTSKPAPFRREHLSFLTGLATAQADNTLVSNRQLPGGNWGCIIGDVFLFSTRKTVHDGSDSVQDNLHHATCLQQLKGPTIPNQGGLRCEWWRKRNDQEVGWQG